MKKSEVRAINAPVWVFSVALGLIAGCGVTFSIVRFSVLRIAA
jgi:hypothetical protein